MSDVQELVKKMLILLLEVNINWLVLQQLELYQMPF